jgi:hypothetical protein
MMMGYRSDVAIAMYAVDNKDAPAIKLWLTENFPVKEWEDEIRWFDRGMILSANNIKWYDDTDEIKDVLKALHEFEELFIDDGDTPEGAYEFVRIGEDDDDVAQRREGNYEWLISLERSIHIQA